jgi:hypothetical protein
MSIKGRISRLEIAAKGSSPPAELTIPEECICFPVNEPRCLHWRAEVEAAAAIQCPLHGGRFKRVERFFPYQCMMIRQARCLILRDGTEIPAQGYAEEWHPCLHFTNV